MDSKTEPKQNKSQIRQKLRKKHSSCTDQWREVDWMEGIAIAMKSEVFMNECKAKCEVPHFNVNGFSLLMRLKDAVEREQCWLKLPTTLVPNAALRAIVFLDFEPCAPPQTEHLLINVPLKELELPGMAPQIQVHSIFFLVLIPLASFALLSL
jgi:hypothetical protein